MSLTTSKRASDCLINRCGLRDYQLRAIDTLIENKFHALWACPGLGKTVTTLCALSDLFDAFEISKVLVIAPLRVVEHTWPKEIAKWEKVLPFPMDFSLIVDSYEKRRIKSANSDALLHFVNVEKVPWLIDYKGKNWDYDIVVIDESSKFKSHSSKRFKKLKKVLHKIERLIELTGTPASNGLLDIWSQIYLLDQGESLEKFITHYRKKYFDVDYSGFNWSLKGGAEEEIHNRISHLVLRLDAKDYLDLPPIIENTIEIDLPLKLRAQYKELEKNFLLELENDSTIVALSQASLSNKLLQFCNGAVYIDSKIKQWEEVHNEKLKAFHDLVEENANQSILAAYNFISDKERIVNFYPKKERRNICTDASFEKIDSWNTKEIPIFLLHPASVGHGLNFQDGGNTVVWFGLNWSLELYQQFNKRLHRQGQKEPVIVHHLVIKDSIEQTVSEALKQKDITQQKLLDAVKRDIKGRV